MILKLKLHDKIKIFLMTAFDIKDLKNDQDFKTARIDKILQKHIRFSELREMINIALKD